MDADRGKEDIRHIRPHLYIDGFPVVGDHA